MKAKAHPESDRHVICPVCETACDITATVRLCSGCGSTWSVQPNGDVIFDADRRADRQSVGEAQRAEALGATRGLEGAARRRPRRLGKKR